MTEKKLTTTIEGSAIPTSGMADPSASVNQSMRTTPQAPLLSPEGDEKKPPLGEVGRGPFPRSIRGTLKVLNEEHDLEFRATRATGESNREEISSTKNSQLYKTKGTKQQTLVAHLTARPDSPDPLADMYGQLQKLAKDAKLETKEEPKLRGEKLLDSKNLSVILSKKEHKIDVRISIDLAQHPDYKDEFYKAIVELNKCFSINQQKVLSALPAPAKNSSG